MNDFVQQIKQRLERVSVLENKRDALKGLYLSISVISSLVLLFGIIESLARFSPDVRTFLFYSVIIICIVLFTKLVLLPLLKNFTAFTKPDYYHTAKEVGNIFPEIKDDLLNSLQLISAAETNFSSQLINAAFERIYKLSQPYNFGTVVDFSSTKKYLRTSLIIFFSTVILFIIVPGLSSAGYRLINYNINFVPPQKFYFEVSPGNSKISKGDNVTVKIKAVGQNPGHIFLSTKSEEQTEYIEKKLLPDSTGNFSFEFAAVNSSFNYFASSEGIESSNYKITVTNRPIISTYEIDITPPAYSRLPKIIQKDNGNITALPGSRVQLNINASRELSKAKISFNDGSEKQMHVKDVNGSVDFNISKDANYQMHIIDAQGFGNINPITYSIKTLTDDPPTIELVSPDLSGNKANKPIKLGSDPKISVISKIKDDYGFTKLNLNYRLSASKYRPLHEQYTQIPISINKNLKEDEIYYVWDLSPLVLAEGEAVSCYLEIFDNDIVSGPKSAKSPLFTIEVPSLNELFAGAENTQQEASQDLAETFKEAEKLQEELQNISNDLKQNNREISWQEKERVEKAAEKFKELTGKVDEISLKLADMKKDLMQNNLLSKETLEKYNELQKLLDEMSSDEMKEAMKRLQESLKSLMRDNVQMSLDEMKANEEYFKKSLERTVNLLKRIQIEQKIDELVKRTEDLTQKLDELKDKTNQSDLSDKQQNNELSDRQKDAAQDMKNLHEEMNKLDEKMSEMKDLPKDQLEKTMQDFDKQKNQELSKEALEDLQKMQKMQAMKNQQQLSQNMQSMNKQFQNLQSAMQQMNQMKTFYGMMKILDDMITLSKSQEKLKDNTDQLSSNSQQLQENARAQNEVQDNLNKVLQNMSALSQKTFAITPEMGKALGQAYSEMQQSITSMQNQNGALASQFQKQAMQHLNEAASLMKGGMDQMMNGGQGGGMMSMMQQLQQLSQQQMNLNQLTQMMNQGKLTQEMMSQMQRLAQQQEMIRKSLDQLNKEARESGESKRLAANLEKIMEQMREVVTNLQTEKINDDLVKQQEKILSRMLDAQRSINERDFEKNRISNTGQNIARTSPPDLILSTEEGKNKLKDELLKAINEGYKKDYEDLIRKYFEALEKAKQ